MTIPNIVFDVALMILPLGWLWRIHYSLSQKIALGVVYALAGLVVALGALRLHSIVKYRASADFTWDFLPVAIFTAVETNSALTCACLPALNPLLQFCLHGKFAPLPTIQSRTSYRAQQQWPGQQRDLSAEETEELARITGGEAPRNYPFDEPASESSAGARRLMFGKKPAKKERMGRRGDASYLNVDVEEGIALHGLEPPRRTKGGWATPRESRFSDW